MFLLDTLLWQRGIDREEDTILNNTLAKSLGSGIADDEEEGDVDDNDEESANVEDDSVEENKTENEKIKSLIPSTVEYLIQPDKKELLELVN